MARGRSGTGKGLGGLRTSGGEAVQLVIDYLKQETLTPLRGLGRFVLFGVAGSVALAIGLVILAVAFLRVLQGETGTTFTGNLVVGAVPDLHRGGSPGGRRRRPGRDPGAAAAIPPHPKRRLP